MPEKRMMREIDMTNNVVLHHGDCLSVMRSLPDESIDVVITDPPYGLEFMGKGWDAPWTESDVNADAGMSGTGYTDGGKRLPRPSFTGSTNPKCLDCKGTRRGRRDGTAKVAVCLCKNGGRFPNTRAVEMRAFGEWCGLWTAECLRVLKPGGHFFAFGGTRTWHRLACAVEDAGFEVRDSIAWLYGTGFPKSLDVSKAIDKAARGVPQGGVDPTSPNHGKYRTTTTEGKRWDGDSGRGYGAGGSRFLADGAAGDSGTGPAESGGVETAPEAEQWQGWGTALKPAFEPIVVARKPLAGTVAANVLEHGTGALNIDATRVQTDDNLNGGAYSGDKRRRDEYTSTDTTEGAVPMSLLNRGIGDYTQPAGRWPANVVLDDTQAAALDEMSGDRPSGGGDKGSDAPRTVYGQKSGKPDVRVADSGGASRFFPTFRYEAKAKQSERPDVDGVKHPTVKPLALMQWLVRLGTPPGGIVLDPFAGSGTTMEAACKEGFASIGIERDETYIPLIEARLHRSGATYELLRCNEAEAKEPTPGEEEDQPEASEVVEPEVVVEPETDVSSEANDIPEEVGFTEVIDTPTPTPTMLSF